VQRKNAGTNNQKNLDKISFCPRAKGTGNKTHESRKTQNMEKVMGKDKKHLTKFSNLII
jgi:hypothetical protein